MDGRLRRRRTRFRWSGDGTSASRDGTALLALTLLGLTAVLVLTVAARLLGLV